MNKKYFDAINYPIEKMQTIWKKILFSLVLHYIFSIRKQPRTISVEGSLRERWAAEDWAGLGARQRAHTQAHQQRLLQVNQRHTVY